MVGAPEDLRLALLDRDGTINRKAPDGEYVLHPDELVVLPGATEAIRRLNQADISVVVVTNQRCIHLGLLDEDGLAAIHKRLADELGAHGARIDAWFFCPHGLEDDCCCRKPRPGMLLDAMAHFAVCPEHALMVGDSDSDIAAGCAAGVRTAAVGSRVNASADFAAPDLFTLIHGLVTERSARR